MKIGYARVSTADQSLDLQIDALKQAGCNVKDIFSEKISGAKRERPQLNEALSKIREGDIFTVWKIDRLGRSLKDLVNIVEEIKEKGAHFVSLQDGFNTSTAGGKLVFHFFASLAEFERSLVSERTKAGLKSARARGRVGGRPKGLSEETKGKAHMAGLLYKENSLSIGEICKRLKISKTTLYRYLRIEGIEIGAYTKKTNE